jgi:PAS domain S-box-containing protein
MSEAGQDTRLCPPSDEMGAKAEMLELLFQATNDGVVDWDLVGNRTSYNDRWRFLLGWDEGGFVLTADTWRELIHEDERPLVAQAIADHLQQGWPFLQTVRMRHRSLGWRWILIRGAASRNDQGDAIRMAITFADVDERVRAESEIRALVEAIPDTILRVRSDGTVLAIKEGNRLESTNPTNVTHGPFEAIRDSPSGPELMKAIRAAGETKAAAHVACRVRTASGEAADYDVRIVTCGPDEAVCIVRDVTHEKAIEEQVARGRKLEAIGELAGGLAHEMNTPLQYTSDSLYYVQDAIPPLLDLVDGYRDLLHQGGEPSSAALAALAQQEESLDLPLARETIARALNRGLKGIEQIDRLVRAMKAFNEVGRQGKVLQELNPIVDNATIVATHTWSPFAEVSLQLGQDLPLVPCWAGEIAQVVVNLLSNATHAIRDKVGNTGKKGKITIETVYDPVGQAIEIRISDNGVGIPDNIREKIFDPFFTTRPVGQGSGQGLAQVHAAIVQLHGGKVRFDSHLGEGTRFIVSLPIQMGR